jgi:hypothetical protein
LPAIRPKEHFFACQRFPRLIGDFRHQKGSAFSVGRQDVGERPDGQDNPFCFGSAFGVFLGVGEGFGGDVLFKEFSSKFRVLSNGF